MIRIVLLTSILAASLLPLPAEAQTRCAPGNNNLSAYMQRNNDRRCEGIQFVPHSGSGFELISLTIGQPQAQNNQLTLQIPFSSSGKQPSVGVKAWKDRNGNEKYYQLDPLALRRSGSKLEFRWSTREVLDPEKIPYNGLRALATVTSGVYVPIVFGSASKKAYSIVLLGDRPVTIKSFAIRDSKGTTVYRASKRDAAKGEVLFTWNGRQLDGKEAPAGRYRLSVDAELKRPTDPAPLNIAFEHNPQWLK